MTGDKSGKTGGSGDAVWGAGEPQQGGQQHASLSHDGYTISSTLSEMRAGQEWQVSADQREVQ